MPAPEPLDRLQAILDGLVPDYENDAAGVAEVIGRCREIHITNPHVAKSTGQKYRGERFGLNIETL